MVVSDELPKASSKERGGGGKVNFFFENLSLVPETSASTREVMEHFKLVFGSGTSDLAKIRPLKNWPPPFPGSHRLLGTSIFTRTESQGKGRGITIKVVSLKLRPLDTQLIVKVERIAQER